jgi:very-short-patch-repair endonuclease
VEQFIIPGLQLNGKPPKRRLWRADFCWPDHKLIVEFEGGVFIRGRHTRGKPFEADCIKYNTATLMGYRVLRFTERHVTSGYAILTIKAALGEQT